MLSVSNVAVVPDQQARQGLLPDASGVVQLRSPTGSRDAALHVVLAGPERAGIDGERTAERHGAIVQLAAAKDS